MNLSDSQTQTPQSQHSEAISEPNGSQGVSTSMDEYYKLKKSIFFVTLTITGTSFLLICVFSSLNIALSYLIGALGGMMYLRMLAKNVEKLSAENTSSNYSRLALFVGLIIIAAKWDQLNVLPLFLGFLTYKAAIIFYVVPNSLIQVQKSD